MCRLLGLTDLSNEGTFVWEGGQSEPEFTDWRAGEPNDMNDSEDCVFIANWNDLLGMTWTDMSCAAHIHPLFCPFEIRSLYALCQRSP